MNSANILWSWSRQEYGDAWTVLSEEAEVRSDITGLAKCARRADQHGGAIVEFDNSEGEYRPVMLCTRCVRALADAADAGRAVIAEHQP